MRLSQLAFALSCAMFGVACVASRPAGLNPARAASAVGPLIRQTARPTTCPDATQPAILGLAGAQKTPVWGCLPACPLGQEPVSNVVTWGNETQWELQPGCQAVCLPEEHRTSYFDVEKRGHCSPGAVTDGAQLATLAREHAYQAGVREKADREAARLGAIAAQNEAEEAKQGEERRRRMDLAALARVDTDLQTLEGAPTPWSFEQVQLQYRFPERLRSIEKAMKVDPARLQAWSTRVDALDGKRKASEVALGVRRGGRHVGTTTRAMRAKECQTRCEEDATPCQNSCRKLPAGACATCDQEVRECQNRCTGN